MSTKFLLLKDVGRLGRSGDIVRAKPGFARNYLLPQKMAVIADKNTIRMQEKLQEERRKQAVLDLKEAEVLAARLKDAEVTTIVKVDHEGHMYGSVAALDIVDLLRSQQNVEIEKSAVQLKHPIKTTGTHTIELKCKEGVVATFTLKVMVEEGNGTEPPQVAPGAEAELI